MLRGKSIALDAYFRKERFLISELNFYLNKKKKKFKSDQSRK